MPSLIHLSSPPLVKHRRLCVRSEPKLILRIKYMPVLVYFIHYVSKWKRLAFTQRDGHTPTTKAHVRDDRS